jgi:hypothetical protein
VGKYGNNMGKCLKTCGLINFKWWKLCENAPENGKMPGKMWMKWCLYVKMPGNIWIRWDWSKGIILISLGMHELMRKCWEIVWHKIIWIIWDWYGN